ncbi:MAG: hypothetical protein WKG07_15095 [Hymenobacter sp.]
MKAMKLGAFDYLTKGDFEQQLVVVVERAAEKARLQHRVAELEKRVGQRHSFESHGGRGPGAAPRPAPGPAGGAYRQHGAARRAHRRG